MRLAKSDLETEFAKEQFISFEGWELCIEAKDAYRFHNGSFVSRDDGDNFGASFSDLKDISHVRIDDDKIISVAENRDYQKWEGKYPKRVVLQTLEDFASKNGSMERLEKFCEYLSEDDCPHDIVYNILAQSGNIGNWDLEGEDVNVDYFYFDYIRDLLEIAGELGVEAVQIDLSYVTFYLVKSSVKFERVNSLEDLA